MTEMMEKVWNEYEAEKAAGNAETAEMIGNVYTALDMIETDGENADEDFLLKTYYGFSGYAFQKEKFNHGRLFEIRMVLENEMVKDGFLEADEEPEDEEEDLNTSSNWDEWELDHMYDCYRDDRMAYEM